MTTARGFRYATSVGGTLTGRGGNLLILDDPISAQDAHSERARESLKQWYANTLLSRLDNKAEDAIIVVTQRLHVDDLVGHLLEQGDWTVLNLPAIAEIEQVVPLGPDRYHHRKVGELLHPEREPRSALEELKRVNGLGRFCRPVSAGANCSQAAISSSGHWFTPYDEPPRWELGDKLIVSWDTAMSAGELCDYSACVVLQVKGEDAYLLGCRARTARIPGSAAQDHRGASSLALCHQQLRAADRKQGFGHELDPRPEARRHSCHRGQAERATRSCA